jgi:hypothetical protein
MPACLGTICTTFRCAKRSTAVPGNGAGSRSKLQSELRTALTCISNRWVAGEDQGTSAPGRVEAISSH